MSSYLKVFSGEIRASFSDKGLNIFIDGDSDILSKDAVRAMVLRAIADDLERKATKPS
jgi:hypothetical protein